MIKAGLGGAKARRRERLAVLRGKTSAAIGPGVGSAQIYRASEEDRRRRSAAKAPKGFEAREGRHRRWLPELLRKPKGSEACEARQGVALALSQGSRRLAKLRNKTKGAGAAPRARAGRRKTKVKLRGRGLTKHCRL